MLGQVLKCIRISQGRKPKEVADELKISITRVCDIEAGRKNVTLNSLETFATFYQLPASKILEWEEQAKSKSMCYQEILCP